MLVDTQRLQTAIDGSKHDGQVSNADNSAVACWEDREEKMTSSNHFGRE